MHEMIAHWSNEMLVQACHTNVTLMIDHNWLQIGGKWLFIGLRCYQCVTVPKMLDDTDTDTFFRY